MDLERAKVISLVAQTIINSATVEVKLLNATGNRGAGVFFEDESKVPRIEGTVSTMPRKLGA